MHVPFLGPYLPCLLAVCTYNFSPSLHRSFYSRASPSSFTLIPLSISSPLHRPIVPAFSHLPVSLSRHSPFKYPPLPASYVCSLFWVLCGLKVYLGAIVLCIHTYTYDLHVYPAISSVSIVFLYSCNLPPPSLVPPVYIDVPWGDAYIRQKTDGIKILASRLIKTGTVPFARMTRGF